MNDFDVPAGLSSAEAAAKLAAAGFNELNSSKPKPLGRILIELISEPMFILLIACGSLYILLGDVGEGIMLMSSVVIIIAITLFQQRRTARALEALRDLSSPRALVRRDGQEIRIAAREVVVDDIIVLLEGDRVCADGDVLETSNLKVDESLLTGESVAVHKSPKEIGTPDESGVVMAGTLIVQGRGLARVTATGMNTAFGKIGSLLEKIEEEPTLLQKETKRIVKIFSVTGLVVCVMLFMIYGILRTEWLQGMLAGLSLAMAMLPEEFPVVLTIFMALGAWKMSRRKVLTRQPQAVETLGAISVLCTDKTGTITRNEMIVRQVFAEGSVIAIPRGENLQHERAARVLQYGTLACHANPFDPMEHAIVKTGALNKTQVPLLIKEYPLTPDSLFMTHVYSQANGTPLIAAKGSPETIVAICRAEGEKRREILEQTSKFASNGFRVIAVASGSSVDNQLPARKEDFEYSFMGLIALEDPMRDSIPGDVRSCYEAGIRIIMITGDYPGTAQAISRQMGLHNCEECITGEELSAMPDEVLRERIKRVNIFARVTPVHKLRIVQTLKSNGEVVAMTGDGVNDAPSLKAAHVGIAMGQRGTDVARESASLVLLDDNFSSIVSAIRMGRRIYDNIKKAMGYVFAVHIPIAGLTVIPALLLNTPMILMPLHIAFMELIIDPACTLIFEAEGEEANVMKRRPRKYGKPIFGAERILLSTLQGLFVLAASLVVLFVARSLVRPIDEIRALVFTTLVLANIGLIFVNRSWSKTGWEMLTHRNASVFWVTGSVIACLAIVLLTPGIRNLFHFDILHVHDILICIAASMAGLIWFELLKIVARFRRTREVTAAG